jgi:hypothetical protein
MKIYKMDRNIDESGLADEAELSAGRPVGRAGRDDAEVAPGVAADLSSKALPVLPQLPLRRGGLRRAGFPWAGGRSAAWSFFGAVFSPAGGQVLPAAGRPPLRLPALP